MKKLFLLSFVCCSFLSAAQKNSISGRVIDADTKEVLPFATLVVQNTIIGTNTDENGIFELVFNESVKKQTLIVRYIGYEAQYIVLEKEKFVYDIFLKNNNSNLSEVVVTGTMKAVSKMDSPVPIEVYTPAFFKRNPTPNLFTALENVNGVRPQLNCNVCNTGDIHINGMEGAYTMVMIDGMPIVSALSTVYGLMGIPNSMVQRIEVVKGPASTLYGSEAVGGLINVITKDPQAAPRFSFDVNSTTYQEHNADFSVRGNIKNASTILGLNGFWFDKKWDINNDNFTDLTLQKRMSVFNKWNFRRKNNRQASVALRYVYEDRYGGELQFTQKLRGSDSIYGESISTKRLELIGNYQLPTTEKLVFSYSYNFHDQNSAYASMPYIAQQQIGFSQLTWDKTFEKHDILAGAAFRYTFYDDNTPATASPSNVYLPGVFVQDEIKLASKHKVLVGIRYDYNSAHGHIFTPRLNYQWKPNTNNTLRWSFGNGYRVANVFSEDHAALTGARQVVIVDGLRPERSYNTNLNYTTRFYPSFGFVGLDFSAFYTYFNNKIVADYFTDANKIIFDNLNGYGISKGITINTDFNFKNGLKVLAGATFLDVYQNERDAVTQQYIRQTQIQAPPFSATWSCSYTFPSSNVTVDYTGNLNGPMLLPTLPNDFRPSRSPWFSTQNIQVTKRFNNSLEIYGGIKNLLNFVPKDPILRPFDPFDKKINENNPNGYTFDPSYNYAPIQSIRGFVGVRMSIL
jgi:outer membrane receptor for ferrienterochelin and colicins